MLATPIDDSESHAVYRVDVAFAWLCVLVLAGFNLAMGQEHTELLCVTQGGRAVFGPVSVMPVGPEVLFWAQVLFLGAAIAFLARAQTALERGGGRSLLALHMIVLALLYLASAIHALLNVLGVGLGSVVTAFAC